MKVCTSCKKELPDDCFHKRKYTSGNIGLQPKCKKCSSKRRAGYYNPEDYIKRKFNLSESEYQELIQHNSCQVCGKNISGNSEFKSCKIISLTDVAEPDEDTFLNASTLLTKAIQLQLMKH
mgnify:CR=1 FL=1